jgi:ribonuclease HI
MNIDGSFHVGNHTGGWGLIVRDTIGQAVGAGSGAISYAFDSLQTEAAACLAGLVMGYE